MDIGHEKLKRVDELLSKPGFRKSFPKTD